MAVTSNSQILCFPRIGNLTTSCRGCRQTKTNAESDSPSGYCTSSVQDMITSDWLVWLVNWLVSDLNFIKTKQILTLC